MKKVELYTDGACQGNPGPGGWAALLLYGGNEKLVTGSDPDTTNNRMELMAVIGGLEALKEPVELTVFSDSKYITNAFNQHWIDNWVDNRWKASTGKPVKNPDLWQKILELKRPHQIEWKWVKGHSGNVHNERVDQAAVNASFQTIP